MHLLVFKNITLTRRNNLKEVCYVVIITFKHTKKLICWDLKGKDCCEEIYSCIEYRYSEFYCIR